MLLLPLLIACRGPDLGNHDSATPGDGGAGEDLDGAAEAHDYLGTVLDPPIALPDFVATAQDGTARGPADLQGHGTVAWTYLEAGDEVCATDGCLYADLHESFTALGVQVVGLGFEEPADNAAWAEALDFPFELWTDDQRTLSLAWGAVDSAEATAPELMALVLDEQGQAVLQYRWGLSIESDPYGVLADCQAWFGTERR